MDRLGLRADSAWIRAFMDLRRKGRCGGRRNACCLRHHGQWRMCLRLRVNSSGLSSARHNRNEDILIRDDTHLRHHGQWRMCLRLRVNSSGLSSARHNRNEDKVLWPLPILVFREKKSRLQEVEQN